jgi:hypothetical protein
MSENKRLYLGLDIGTTSLKAAVFNEEGERLGLRAFDYTLDTDPATGYIELDAEVYIDMCKRARNFFQDNAGYKDCSTLAAQCKTKIDRLENEKQREEDAIFKNAHRLADQNAYGAKSFRKQRNKTMQWIELGVSAIFLLIICIVYLLESCS